MHWNGSALLGVACAVVALSLLAAIAVVPGEKAQAGQKFYKGEFRVLDPIQSGALTLFPVVRNGDGGSAAKWDYITLDQGLRSGEVEVTEYGKVQGMVRPRHGRPQPSENYRGDRVNTLVLINNSDRPLLLLAGEIVTGGKQDRVIGKDRIVPAHSDPMDLSVFCIEHGRWVESSAKFGAAGKSAVGGFMVQPSVRSKAMVKQDQQEVWASVSRSVDKAEVTAQAAAPEARPTIAAGTTSYAKVLGDEHVSKQVDSIVEPLIRANNQVLETLRKENAVGVVVAVHGEIIWADVFASPDMLAAYWTKLVRSYAAESFDNGRSRGRSANVADAERFLEEPTHGTETSEGETGVYRYREVRGNVRSSFYLEVLLPGTDFNAHISRVVEEGGMANVQPPIVR